MTKIINTGFNVLGTVVKGTANAAYSVASFGGRTVKNFTLISISRGAEMSATGFMVGSYATGLVTLIIALSAAAQKKATIADPIVVLVAGGAITAPLVFGTLISKKIALAANNSFYKSFMGTQPVIPPPVKPLPTPAAAPAS